MWLHFTECPKCAHLFVDWVHWSHMAGHIQNILSMYPLGILGSHGRVYSKCTQHLITGHIGVTCWPCSQCFHHVPSGYLGPCPQCSETCLCLKSYLISGWVGPCQVVDTVHWIGGPSMADHMVIVEVQGAGRVTSQRSSRADGGHVGLAKKLLRNAPISPSLLATLSKTLIRRSRPLIFITTPTPYLWPTCHWLSISDLKSICLIHVFSFLLLQPTSFPCSLSPLWSFWIMILSFFALLISLLFILMPFPYLLFQCGDLLVPRGMLTKGQSREREGSSADQLCWWKVSGCR